MTAFRALVSRAELPVFALGGVRPEHASNLRNAGACGLAVISAVFAAPDPARAVSAFLESWDANG
jgi:thiamine monophosphate synthase